MTMSKKTIDACLSHICEWQRKHKISNRDMEDLLRSISTVQSSSVFAKSLKALLYWYVETRDTEASDSLAEFRRAYHELFKSNKLYIEGMQIWGVADDGANVVIGDTSNLEGAVSYLKAHPHPSKW